MSAVWDGARLACACGWDTAGPLPLVQADYWHHLYPADVRIVRHTCGDWMILASDECPTCGPLNPRGPIPRHPRH